MERPSTPKPGPFGPRDAANGDATQQFVRPVSTDVRIPTLRVVSGLDILRHCVLASGQSVVIGREATTGLQLQDSTVSKRHAKVTLSDGNSLEVEDLGSTNGTTINGQPISRARLHPGDVLGFGGVSLRLDMLTIPELAHLTRVVERLHAADRDPLTGLLNRGWCKDGIPELMARQERNRLALSCAFIDLDHFKRINDTWGHAVGDSVLTIAARLLMMAVRDGDPCVRWGGEEVVVFLPNSGLQESVEAAERIRSALLAYRWESTAPGLSVTASIGVAQRHANEALESWLSRADRAVYQAKSAGRNRVSADSTDTPSNS